MAHAFSMGLTLKYLRIKFQYSLRTLAQKVNRSHTYLARVESGDLSATEDLLTRLGEIYGLRLTPQPADISAWFDTLETVHQALLNADTEQIHTVNQELTRQASDFHGSSVTGEYALLMWVLNVFAEPALKQESLDAVYWVKEIGSLASHPLNFLVWMGLSKVAFHAWHLNAALNRLDQAAHVSQHPHDRAWIFLEKANIRVHRFARQTALEDYQKAKETFGYFNNYKRRAEADIKYDLYHRRQIHQDTVDYEALKARAQTFLLQDVLAEVLMIEGLRAQHLENFDHAKACLHALDLTHPQHYFNACMVLYLEGDEDALKGLLRKRPNTYVMPRVFAHALDFLNAKTKNAPLKVQEKALKHYLHEGLKEKLYGETRRAQYELAKLYETHRRYKDAVHMIESITETILNA